MKANDGMKDVGLLCHLLLHIPYVCLIGAGKGSFINTTVYVNHRQLKETNKTTTKRKKEKSSQEGSAMTKAMLLCMVGLDG